VRGIDDSGFRSPSFSCSSTDFATSFGCSATAFASTCIIGALLVVLSFCGSFSATLITGSSFLGSVKFVPTCSGAVVCLPGVMGVNGVLFGVDGVIGVAGVVLGVTGIFCEMTGAVVGVDGVDGVTGVTGVGVGVVGTVGVFGAGVDGELTVFDPFCTGVEGATGVVGVCFVIL
jgi:hypothetical protein